MSPPRERRWPLLVAGYAVFIALVAGGAAPVYFILEPAKRPLVVRLAAALVMGVAVIHLMKMVRARLDARPPSDFELALEPPRREVSLDPQFVQIRNDLQFGASRSGYFDRVLWPRLVALAERPPLGPAPARLVYPPGRFFRRGPSLITLRNLIAAIGEERT
jgi:hypothetical protein